MAASPPLRILLVGSGGREHAIALKLSQSSKVESIIAVPGNGGTATCPKTTNETSVAPDDYAGLASLALSRSVNLVVPAPDAPLVDGIEGYFSRIGVGIPVFGPTGEAAQLEGSKAFAKDFMRRHQIPTAEWASFTDYERAVAYVEGTHTSTSADAVTGAPHDAENLVIKASGLAAGKGVIIPTSKQEALDSLRSIMVDKTFGASGDEVVIEQFLDGQELSIISFCDGVHIRSFPPAQDHKRALDGDRGPNTGGMGCYAPTRIVTKDLLERIDSEILLPTLSGMRKDGRPFRGVLFTGLMITADGPKVLEYNVRFGDPEAQTLLPLLASDLADIMLSCINGTLDYADIRFEPRFSTTVVVAAAGYPESFPTGMPLTIKPTPPPGVSLYQASTKLVSNSQLQTSGGRVVAVNAVADTLEAAVKLAYKGVELVEFEGMYYRRDIAHRAFKVSPSPSQSQSQSQPESLTYAQAGVSIDAGNAFVEHIKKAVASTRRVGADAEIGGFGGEIDLSECNFPGLPVLAAAIDGVGTKLAVAQAMGSHHNVGIDLVAMNVNDLIVQGAEPLIFLDYYGCSKLNKSVAAEFVAGVADGCRQAGCALVGGETAEMPGMYKGDDYDAAGAAVGALMKEHRLPRRDAMVAGDVLLGLASSGVHSNGFSLVRRILERADVPLTGPAPWNNSSGAMTTTTITAGESLLTPTRIYVSPLLPLIRTGLVKGMAHITGGGLVDNVPRMLPSHLGARITLGAWEIPRVFKWLKAAGNVAPMEMCRTFNNGIGMVLAVDRTRADEVITALTPALGEKGGVVRIGELRSREGAAAACELVGLEDAVWI